MDSDLKTYELAYLLPSSTPEGEILPYMGKLTSMIEDAHGLVKRAETPKRRRLAYPIKKETQGYFGCNNYNIAHDALMHIEKKIKGENLLRHMIIEEEIETRPPFQPRTSRRMPLFGGEARPAREREPAKPEERLDLEALDKKLEEILGK